MKLYIVIWTDHRVGTEVYLFKKYIDAENFIHKQITYLDTDYECIDIEGYIYYIKYGENDRFIIQEKEVQ